MKIETKNNETFIADITETKQGHKVEVFDLNVLVSIQGIELRASEIHDMLTAPKPPTKNARIEYVKNQITTQIASIDKAGFGYLGTVLRVAIFSNDLTKDQWDRICHEFDRQNPEKSWKIVSQLD